MLGSRLLVLPLLLLEKNDETKRITRLPLVVLSLIIVLLLPLPVVDASFSSLQLSLLDANNKWDDSATTSLVELVFFAPFVAVFLDIVSVKVRRPESYSDDDDGSRRLVLLSKAGAPAPAAPTKGNGGGDTKPATREIQTPSRRTTTQTRTTRRR